MKINFNNISEQLAAYNADGSALVNVERDRRYTFSEFHLLTNRIVNMMTDRFGMEKGDFFFAVLNNDNLSLVHLPTIFKGPATAVYSNYRDSIAEKRRQIEHVGHCRIAFVETGDLEAHREIFAGRVDTVICMDKPEDPADRADDVLYFWDLVEEASDRTPQYTHEDREDVLLIRFTGGTTGDAKAVPYTYDNWLAMTDAAYALEDADWTRETITLHTAPLSHGSCSLLLPTYLSGGTTVTLNDTDLVRFCEVVQAERVTAAMAVPTMLYRLLQVPDLENYDLGSLRHIYYGAAPINPDKIPALVSQFGSIFTQVYGASETFAFALELPAADHRADSEAARRRLSSSGHAATNCEVELRDDDGRPVAPGEIGELWMRARGTVSGYFKNAVRTAGEFEDGFWRSGDLARMDEDGYYHIVDRKKDVIISGGFNVYPNDVEAAIASFPGVVMSVAVGIPDEEWGEAVHAEVMLVPGTPPPSVDALITHVKERIGRYKSPKSVTFVDMLPISVAGKLMRRTVRAKYRSPQSTITEETP